MVVLWLPFVVCIVGLLIYLLVKPELNKVAEVGRIMFAFGLLVFLAGGGGLVQLLLRR